MTIGWTIGSVWLGLILLGWRIWSDSRGAGTEIGSSVTNLLLGFWLPATFLVWGLFSMLAERTWLFDRVGRIIEVTGGAAVAIGVAWIGAGLSFHCFVIWRQHPALSRYADPAALGSAITALGGLTVAFWMIL